MSNLTTRAKALVERLPITVRSAVKRAHYARQLRSAAFHSDEPDLGLALELLSPGDWVIDVGANVGHYTVPLARRVGPQGRIIAIEPILETFELLASNINAARLTNVTLLNVACSSDSGTVNLVVPSEFNGFRWMTRAHVAPHGIPVVAFTLDQLAAHLPIRLLKVDTEGHESAVLASATNLIRKSRPVIVAEGDSDRLMPQLSALGYQALHLDGSPNTVYAAEPALAAARQIVWPPRPPSLSRLATPRG